jgi:hypothetical protein
VIELSALGNWVYAAIGLSGLSLVGIVTILLKAGGFINTVKLLTERHKECPIETVSKNVAVLMRENEIIWKSLSVNLGDIVRSHSKQERDELIDKMNKGVSTIHELHRLDTLLRNDIFETPENDIKGGKVALALLESRVAAKIFINQIESQKGK